MRGDEPCPSASNRERGEVFPACAGMNRSSIEPHYTGCVFPACAGMNRLHQ